MLVLKDSIDTVTGTNTYALEADKYNGMLKAIRGGQVRLSLEYILHVVTEMNNEIVGLREALAAKEAEKAPAKKAPAKKAAAKKTVSKKASPKEEIEAKSAES